MKHKNGICRGDDRMEYSIERVKPGDEQILAYIQTESWKNAFANILDKDVLERCTNLERATSMYKRLLEQNIGNGYILKVEGKPHCIAWWDKTREKDMPGYDGQGSHRYCIGGIFEGDALGFSGEHQSQKVLRGKGLCHR